MSLLATVEAATIGLVGLALVLLAVRAIAVDRYCRPSTAVAIGVAGLFAILWSVPDLLAGEWERFIVPFDAFEVMFFGIVGLAVFLYTAEVSREQARRLEASLEAQRTKSRALDEKERLYRTVVNGSPVVLFAIGAEGRVLLAEGQGIDRLGLRWRDPVGRDAFGLLARHPEAAATLRRAMAGETITDTVHFADRVLETTLTPLHGPDGSVTQVLGLAVDITERAHREEAERTSLVQRFEIERLQEIDAFKTRLLNTASHELNTPITPLMLQLHVLKGALDGEDAKQRRAVDILDRNVRRLAELVKDVLDVARMQSGTLRIDVEPLRLGAVIEEILETYAVQAEDRGVRLEAFVDGGAEVVADPSRLHQVLSNLVANGLRFTGRGGRVAVSSHPEGDAMMVEVRDDGAGLAPDQMQRLFQPFSQVHDPQEHNVGGTGLGLYISKGIVEQMGGQIGCDSEGPGRGAVFWFTVPRGRTMRPLRAAE